MKRVLHGWGRHHRAAMTLLRPERQSQCASCLASPSVLPIGRRRSYGDQCLNDDGAAVLMTQLNRFVSFDGKSGLLTAESGVTFRDILHHFVPRGFIPPVLAGTSDITVGGALANDIHGKNHHNDGSFGCHVRHCDLMTSDGTVHHVRATREPSLWHATIGGCGLTGIIVRVSFVMKKIASPFMRVSHHPTRTLHEMLAWFQNPKPHPYEVAWFNMNDQRGICSSAFHERENSHTTITLTKPRFVPMPSAFLNATTVALFNRLYYELHRLKGRNKRQSLYSYFFPLDGIAHWNRWYGKNGFHQCQLVLPHDTASHGLARIVQLVRHSSHVVPLAVIKRLGTRSSGGLVSFPMPGMTLAMDIKHHRHCPELFRELEAITLDHQGRWYLAKDDYLSPRGFAAMYPRHKEWQKIRRAADPHGIFTSNMARRLQLTS